MLNFLLHPITQLSFRHSLEYPVMDLIHSLRNWNSPKGGEENVTVIAHRKKDARFQCRSWKDKGLMSKFVHFTMNGSVHSIHLEEKIDRVDRQIERTPDLSKQDGSNDMGITLLESMSAIGDLLSFYQSKVSQEAYLGSSRERLSQKEENIRPKLKSIVTFCDRIDSKTQKKMGLSDSDIRKVKTTATITLQMIESRMCSGCGAVNRPGTTQCQNCGAHL